MTKAELISRLLELKVGAMGRATADGHLISEVRHNGLTLWYYDPRIGLPPAVAENTHPLCIEAREGREHQGQFKLVFRAFVDPDEIPASVIKLGARGPWQIALDSNG